MPYEVAREGKEFVVRNRATGKVKGKHASRAEAQRQMNLLLGIEHGFKPTQSKK